MTINVFGGGNSSAPVFPVQRSVRLRSSASASFSRTQTTTTNALKWTYSTWVKRGSLTNSSFLMQGYVSGTNRTPILFASTDALNMYYVSGGSVIWQVVTNAVFRDPSAWYHVVVAFDSTDATSSNRLKMYVNGVQQTFSSATYPSLNQATQINASGNAQYLGTETSTPLYFDGYMTEVNFIDGQALTPSSFGSINSSTGVWQPIKYSGTYGTNGFYLNFQDNSAATAAAIGKDSSGNGNNWTPNNISVTAGVTYDSMVDVPTLTSASNANFAVGNPLNADGTTWSGGNLNFSLPNSTNNAQGTMSVTSGKWYWEVVYSSGAQGTGVQEIGLRTRWTSGVVYSPDGTKYVNGTNSAYGAAYTTGDVIGVALDMDGGTVTFYKNNVSQGAISLTGSGCVNATFTTTAGGGVTSVGSVNFGQRPFTYTPPTGFKSLNTYNLPDSTIVKGSTQFNTVLDTGANIKTTSQALYTNYLEWIKDRANVNNHQLVDSVRGSTAVLQSNTTGAETTYTAPSGNSVGWVWNANATAVPNTSGSITSQVSANPSAGFSIVTYTGTGANATVGHGLGIAPKMVIVKSRSGTPTNWPVYHSTLAASTTLNLNSTNASTSSPTVWNSTTPTSNVFSIGTANDVNFSTATYVAYCFSEIAGYSKFGSYTGNGSTDGPFVYLGFRPRFVMYKRTDSTGNWFIDDSSRVGYNVITSDLLAEASNAEASYNGGIDFLSNGFKQRASANGNASGGTFIYMAFAESPFSYSLAR